MAIQRNDKTKLASELHSCPKWKDWAVSANHSNPPSQVTTQRTQATSAHKSTRKTPHNPWYCDCTMIICKLVLPGVPIHVKDACSECLMQAHHKSLKGRAKRLSRSFSMVQCDPVQWRRHRLDQRSVTGRGRCGSVGEVIQPEVPTPMEKTDVIVHTSADLCRASITCAVARSCPDAAL